MGTTKNLDDFLTTHLLIEDLARAAKVTNDSYNFLKNILEVFSLAPEQAFLDSKMQELPNKKIITLNIMLDKIPEELPILKKKLTELLSLGDIQYEAKKALEEINMMPRDYKSKYKIYAKGQPFNLSDFKITSILNLGSKGISIEFSSGGMSTEEGIEAMNSVFRKVLGFNVLYTMIINYLRKLNSGLVALTPKVNQAKDEKEVAKIVNDLLISFSPDKARVEGNDIESSLQLSLKKITESFLFIAGIPINEEYLRFYDVYEDKIPNITSSNDISNKFFIESLTRIYKTLKESIDIDLQNKSDKVNISVKKKALKLEVPKESRTQVINEFIKKDIEEQKVQYVKVIEEIVNEIKEILERAESQPSTQPTTTAPGTETNKKVFNIQSVLDLVRERLKNYEDYYDVFIKKIQKSS